MRGGIPLRGWKVCEFECDASDAELLRTHLTTCTSTREIVDHASITYVTSKGKLFYTLDLSRLPIADVQCVRLMIDRELHGVRSRHRLPSEPPPVAA